ncbi:MAG: sulfurtransferase-like selenium metabolism protein YedF [Firmicutes bacterium]|nr:sulfurtransferase-like selenium metabolism protein YedF [Bacillota bacterium]MBR2748763.1 sulfurtransferase-like selenium metabolism protein YedF [Bacillota bacterium]
METIKVDAMGKQCPIPVIMTKKVLQGLTGPAVIRVEVDNEVAVQNLTRLASTGNLPVKADKLDEKHFVVTIEADKALESQTEQDAQDEVCCAPDRRGDTVVAIGSATMGVGNDELGKVLIKGFIYSLSQLEELPDTILFYNGGATIPVEGSVSLEDLKNMEAQGVTIKTCGTCLDYYNLKEKLAVGSVTNMYDIVETLSKAARILKP